MRKIKKDYVSTIYDEKRTPKTNYPKKLINYLSLRFNLKSNQKLIELGCGRGDFLNEFQIYGFDCIGLDRDKSSVKNKNNLKVKFCDLSKDSFPFENNSFDIVYHKSVIEHLYDPKNFMKETFRILKPGGKLIILTPDWHSQWKNFYEDFTHSRPYDLTALKDLLAVSGFVNSKVEKFYQLPYVWKLSFIKFFSKILQLFIGVYTARRLTAFTGVQFFRWSVELMILGYAEKGK
tara:strand:+ start:547 stop:1248 length:702 start_codon:yes stop_codon:yes gene_type:complete